VTAGIVLDTSAVVAILQSEDGHDVLLEHMAQASRRLMSTATRVELGLVVEARYGTPGRELADRFLRDAAVELVAVDAGIADRALSAWRRYGKGRHPAALNFGDCFSYALTDDTGFPLLCTGNDFTATDLPTAGPARCAEGDIQP
jgi:ribonuclease VapC